MNMNTNQTAPNPYHPEFDGYYAMWWHDKEENALKRWFDNFRLERCATFATEYEWLIVREVPIKNRLRKVRYVCQIGDDGRGTTREVVMDHTAPPAPILTFAAKRSWQPPPPKSPEDLRREAEYERMYRHGYEPYRRAIYSAMSPIFLDDDDPMPNTIIHYEVEWRLRRPLTVGDVSVPKPPPAPKHRRNI